MDNVQEIPSHCTGSDEEFTVLLKLRRGEQRKRKEKQYIQE